MTSTSAISLSELSQRIAYAINPEPSLQGVWVVAETSDVRVSAHCYLELIEKDPASGQPLARLRANIWSNKFLRLRGEFRAATGSDFASGIKVMVRVNVNYHPSFGLSANITDIDPSYTLGDMLQRRREIIARLTAEGIIDLNRELEWPETPLRIAVISAGGAAGYGDFIHQLFSSPARLAFTVKLFPALMQGASAAPSIISALEAIAGEEENWDGVVIIRGGGATSDLAAFDDYDLAANIAQFPLPVIIGIGHERDVTVLDYVANMRVKTPTAAAEWLINRGEEALDRLDHLATLIYTYASELLSGSRQQLARIEATLPHLPQAALTRASSRLSRLGQTLAESALTRLRPNFSRLDILAERVANASAAGIERSRTLLDRMAEKIELLSPASTLARGYSITRVDGHAVTSASGLKQGTIITTTLADGSITSVTV